LQQIAGAVQPRLAANMPATNVTCPAGGAGIHGAGARGSARDLTDATACKVRMVPRDRTVDQPDGDFPGGPRSAS
jgi:hypothetical protein